MKTHTAWERIMASRNITIAQIERGMELDGENIAFEEWRMERRKIVARLATLPRPYDTEPRRFPSWHAWGGTRWNQYFAATPEQDGNCRKRDGYASGPMFDAGSSLWERYVEAERAMAPVSYAVIACGVAFLGFAAWWMR